MITKCLKCDLVLTRRNIVNGYGNKDATVMVIGDSPSYRDETKELPFMGKHGMILMEHLNNIGLTRESMYMTNLIKCRVPSGEPTLLEIHRCSKYLIQELLEVKPIILITLGNLVTRFIFRNMNLRISNVRGKVYSNTQCKHIIPTYHPAYISKSKQALNEFKEDLQTVERICNIYGE